MQYSEVEKSAPHTASVDRTQRKGTIITIYRRHASGGKHSVGGRMK
jgi:hypothetical protein